MLPHAIYFRGIEIAQFDRELSPARYDIDGSRFHLHIADRADLVAVFLTHYLTNGEDFLCSGRKGVFPAIHRRGARVIGETGDDAIRSLDAHDPLYDPDGDFCFIKVRALFDVQFDEGRQRPFGNACVSKTRWVLTVTAQPIC